MWRAALRKLRKLPKLAGLRKLWTSLPYDGQGLFTPPDSPFGPLRKRAAANFWKRTPWWSRPLLIPMARLGWAVACVSHVWNYARRQELRPRPATRLFVDCVRSGAQPNEALIWRRFFPPPGLHPLPGRAAGRLLSQLGSAADHRLLSDKQATADLLSRASLPVPVLLETIRRGQELDLAGTVWSQPGHLFVKPRHGSAARGAMPVDVLAGNVYRIDGGPIVDASSLEGQTGGVIA